MKKLKFLLYVLASVQIVLGVFYLCAPEVLLGWMGHSSVAPDIGYPLAMLAARFLVYGVLLLVAASNPSAHGLLLNGMVAIQLIDLLAGVVYTASGEVSLALSGFPMFNAALFAVLLWRWRVPSAGKAVLV